MHLRLFRSEDFDQLYAIEQLCFQPPIRFPRTYLRELLNMRDAAAWVAEEDSALVGFAIVEWSSLHDEITAYIQTIEVLAEHRGKGIGKALLRHLEDSALHAGAVQIWLHVDAENQPAVRLYEAQGYAKLGMQRHYYARNRPALVYQKHLGGQSRM